MHSLQNRALAIVLLAALIPIGVLWSFFISHQKPHLKNEQNDAQKAIVTQVCRIVEEQIRSSIQDLATLATNPALINESDREKRITELDRLARLKFAEICLLEVNGFVVASDTSSHQGIQEYSPAFRQSLSSGKINVSEPFVSDDGHSIHLTCFIPVLSNSIDSVRMVKIVMKLEANWKALRSIDLASGGDLLLIDADGRTLFSRAESPVFEKFASYQTLAKLKASEQGIFREDNGREFAFTSIPLDPFDKKDEGREWSIISLIPIEVAHANIHEINRWFITISLLGATSAFGLCLYLLRRVLNPLKILSESAARASEGDFSATVPISGLKEMDQVGGAFNSMLLKIRNQRHELEEEVEERTEALSNAIATLKSSNNAIDEGLLILNTDGEIADVNTGFKVQFTGEKDVTSKDIDFDQLVSIMSPWHEASTDLKAYLNEYCEDSTSVLDEEWTHQKETHRVMQVHSAPILGPGHHPIGRIWVFRDLTEYRTLENKLRQSQKMEAIGTLAGGIAHDFNNLLTAISGNLTLSKAHLEDTPDALNHTNEAIKVTARATGLVKQLLSFSRKSQLTITSSDISLIAKDTKSILKHTLDPSVTLTIDSAPDLWRVDADPNQLQQVLMNLCVNAGDAIGKNGTIEIRFRNVTRKNHVSGMPTGAMNEHLMIEVIDDGEGMPVEVKNNIFDPFFTTKEQGKGTGLGLSTCYGIVNQHGGWMECDSTPGEGTTIRCILPKGIIEIDEGQSPASTGEEVPITKHKPSDFTILIADDEPAVRGVAEILLRRAGYNLVSANNGLEAVRITGERNGDIDLVLLDFTMPEMDGKEAFCEINRLYPKIPAMICSGYVCNFEDFETKSGAIPAGFIQKPYPLEEMIERIGSVLEKRSSEDRINAA